MLPHRQTVILLAKEGTEPQDNTGTGATSPIDTGHAWRNFLDEWTDYDSADQQNSTKWLSHQPFNEMAQSRPTLW